MSSNIPPADISSVLQAQIASRQSAKKIDKEDNDHQRARLERLRAEMRHSSQVEDPDAIDADRPLRDDERRQGRRGNGDHHEKLSEEQQDPVESDEYIPSDQAREQGLAGGDATDTSPPGREPPTAPKRPEYLLDLEA